MYLDRYFPRSISSNCPKCREWDISSQEMQDMISKIAENQHTDMRCCICPVQAIIDNYSNDRYILHSVAFIPVLRRISLAQKSMT